MAEFGKSTGNRYVCQLGSLRNPNLTKGDALGRGLLNDAQGQLDPFKLEELFHRSLITAFQAISDWEEMTYFNKEAAIRAAVSSACSIVGVPPITVGSWLTSGDPTSNVATNAAAYHTGGWYIELSRPRLMNPQERGKDRARALELANELSANGEERAQRTKYIEDKFRADVLPRERICAALAHECQHALQEFISLSLLAGRGFTGDLVPTGPENEFDPPNYRHRDQDGREYWSQPKVWSVAKQHPTQHPYAENLNHSDQQDLGYWALIKSPTVDKLTQDRLDDDLSDPRVSLTRESNATWIQWLVSREVNRKNWVSRTFVPSAKDTWMPAGCDSAVESPTHAVAEEDQTRARREFRTDEQSSNIASIAFEGARKMLK